MHLRYDTAAVHVMVHTNTVHPLHVIHHIRYRIHIWVLSARGGIVGSAVEPLWEFVVPRGCLYGKLRSHLVGDYNHMTNGCLDVMSCDGYVPLPCVFTAYAYQRLLATPVVVGGSVWRFIATVSGPTFLVDSACHQGDVLKCVACAARLVWPPQRGHIAAAAAYLYTFVGSSARTDQRETLDNLTSEFQHAPTVAEVLLTAGQCICAPVGGHDVLVAVSVKCCDVRGDDESWYKFVCNSQTALLVQNLFHCATTQQP
jgi:hypothetical protein